MSVVSVRREREKVSAESVRVNERTGLVACFFFRRDEGFLFQRSDDGRGAGGRARRAREARTPVNPPSLTGRRPDASATSLRLVAWSLGSGRERRFGVGTRRRARTRVACFLGRWAHRDAVSRRRGAAGRARDGWRVGTDAVCVPEPSQRLFGVREFHLRVRGLLRVRLRARGRRPRACRNTLGRAHLARVEAARRERERRMRTRTRACVSSKARERLVPIGLEMDARASVPRAELKCGAQGMSFAVQSPSTSQRGRGFREETHVQGVCP